MIATRDDRWISRPVRWDGERTVAAILDECRLLEAEGLDVIGFLQITPFRVEVIARNPDGPRQMPTVDYDPHTPPPPGPGMDL